MGLTEEELQPLVTAWRTANPNIVKLWWAMDTAVKDAIKGRTVTRTHGLSIEYRGGMLYIELPSGRKLSYVRPRIGENKFGGESVTYMGGKGWTRIESYGPKFVENCISEGTLVITDQGIVPIEKITDDMRIWDGEEFVQHDGLIYQGKKEVISVSNILMTPDHKILTERGWKRSVESDGLNWADVRLPNSASCSPSNISIQSEGLSKPVYDIRNCGSRHRFAVWANDRAYIVSNCVQGISRDILCHALEQLKDYRVVAHVHDECIVECPSSTTVEEISDKMSIVPSWATGLILRADGYECTDGFYMKD